MEVYMATLIIGGDKIDSIRDELLAQGVTDIAHWVGRKHGDKNNTIPKNTQRIVVLTNYVNHSLVGKIKKEAKRLNIPIEYTKNSRRYMSYAA
jgi:hypothetical protein